MFYTPDELAQFIKTKFKQYRDAVKPDGLKDLPEVKLDSPKETFEQFKQQPKETAQRIIGFLKFEIAEIPGQLRTHSSVIKRIEIEIDNILAEEKTSALKKMCDMAILIYGLSHYLNRRDSEQMIIFITEITTQLWSDTPEFDETAFVKLFSEQIKNVRNHLNVPEENDLNYRSLEIPHENPFIMEAAGGVPIANLGDSYQALLVVQVYHDNDKGKEEAHQGASPLHNDNNAVPAKKPKKATNAYAMVDKILSAPERNNRLGRNNFLVVMNSSQQEIAERDQTVPITNFTGDQSDDEDSTDVVDQNPFK